MVLRVRPTPTRFPTNSLYTPVDKHTLAFYIKCVPPVGRLLLPRRLEARHRGFLCGLVPSEGLSEPGECWRVISGGASLKADIKLP